MHANLYIYMYIYIYMCDIYHMIYIYILWYISHIYIWYICFFQTWCMIFICVLDVFLRMKDIDPRRLTFSGRPQPVAPQMAAANRPAPPRQSYAQPGKPSGCQWFFPWVFLQKMVDIYIYCCRYYIWCMYIWCTQLCIMYYVYVYVYIVSIVAHNYLILYIIYVYMYVYILYIYM